jgi:hypothetical protein
MGAHGKTLIESKVKASTAATFGASVAIAVLNQAVADDSLMGSVPSWAQTGLLVVVPSLVTFLSGWKARHTPRPDLSDAAPAVQ